MPCRKIVSLSLALTVSILSHLHAGETKNGDDPMDIGSRRELFVDDVMIDELSGGAERRLHHPVHREIVARFGDQGEPWEGNIAYLTAIRDGDRVLLYYSARAESKFKNGVPREKPILKQFACVLESSDGVNFHRPKLGRYDISMFFAKDDDTKDNNVVWASGPATHNFTPFLDEKPGVPPEERFKAIGRGPGGAVKRRLTGGPLFVYASPDGLHWDVLIKKGFGSNPTDSQNGAFWDPTRGFYACYLRAKPPERENIRDIRRCVSKDLVEWSEPELLQYEDDRREHMYTNGIQPYFRAPHILVGTPARFVPKRKKVKEHPSPGVSDAVLMSSRDGIHFERWEEAFIRPGTDPKVWTDRNNYPAPGVIQTSPTEMSFYWTEHYKHETPRIRRGTLRLDGFVSIHAGGEAGELLSCPFVFNGDQLEVNVATSAVGSIRFELRDAEGKPIPGFTMKDSEELFGNEIEHVVTWKGKSDVSALAGKPVRLRVKLRDADLYSLRFAESKSPITDK